MTEFKDELRQLLDYSRIMAIKKCNRIWKSPYKLTENQMFFSVFRENKMKILARNGLKFRRFSSSMNCVLGYSEAGTFSAIVSFLENFLKTLSFRGLSYYQIQKHPFRGVPQKRCSKNKQQIYSRTPMPMCNFNKVEITLRHGCSPVNLLYISRTFFLKNTSERLLGKHLTLTFDEMIH